MIGWSVGLLTAVLWVSAAGAIGAQVCSRGDEKRDRLRAAYRSAVADGGSGFRGSASGYFGTVSGGAPAALSFRFRAARSTDFNARQRAMTAAALV